MNLQQEIQQLEARADHKEDDHKQLKKKIKGMKVYDVNALMHAAHDEAFAQTDCLACGNCCKSIPPLLENDDVRRIAKHLKMPIPEFRKKYMTRDEDGDPVFNKTPCRFLGSDNKCSIYEIRPRACAEYPFTNYNNTKNVFGMVVLNASICPAVSKVLDIMERSVAELGK
jgi:Fe-S-cluster containining protein